MEEGIFSILSLCRAGLGVDNWGGSIVKFGVDPSAIEDSTDLPVE